MMKRVTEVMPLMSFNFGPQHPGSHPFNLQITVDGDIIVDVKANIGYVHRGLEKQAEYRTFIQNIPIMERSCFLDAINHEWGYILAVERLTGTQDKVPKRAEYLRVISAELSRINSLISWFGGYASELGVSTAFMWAWYDRERFLDLFGNLTGGRVSLVYLTVGGVRWDWNAKLDKMTWDLMDYMEERIKKYIKFVMKNKIFIKRTKGVGVVTKDFALKYAFSGPNLRASGIQGDLRVKEPYGIYDQFKFEPKVYTAGDSWTRTMIRLDDIRTSMNIIRQALTDMPDGPIKGKIPRRLKAREGEVYSRVELSRGILGYYIKTKANALKPYRLKIRGASFAHFNAVPELLIGHKIADIPAITGSLDVCPADLDR